jgi:tellurite resistance protein
MRNALLGILLAGFLTGPALADVITLADGSKREGKVLRETDQEVVLQVTQGRLSAEITFKRGEVKSVEKGATAADKTLAEVERRKAALKDKDAIGWLEFAQWLDKQPGFSRDVREACEKVVSLEPNNDYARTKLGYQQVGGQWLTEAEVMAAKGLVAHQGKWVTPEEKKAAEEAASKTEDITVLTPEELRKRRAQEQFALGGKKLAEWQAQMLSRTARAAAQNYPPEMVWVRSGGVVLGPYGYGFYGVTTSDGQYLSFVPYNGQNAIYFDGVWFGTDGPMFFNSTESTVSSGFRFNFDFQNRHLHLRFNSGR